MVRSGSCGQPLPLLRVQGVPFLRPAAAAAAPTAATATSLPTAAALATVAAAALTTPTPTKPLPTRRTRRDRYAPITGGTARHVKHASSGDGRST